MLSEYHFDYSKAKPNRFAKQAEAEARITVTLEPDVARIFTTSEHEKHAPVTGGISTHRPVA